MKKVLITLLASTLVLSLGACAPSSQDDSASASDSSSVSGEDSQVSDNDDKELTFGSTFEFDDLEITIGTEIGWTAVDNQFSDHNGADVIALPITIKNLKDETHGLNMFYYDFYGSNGTKLDSVSSYFMDEEVGFAAGADSLRSGATEEAKMFILYDGDGDYYIEFSTMLGSPTEVKLPIAK